MRPPIMKNRAKRNRQPPRRIILAIYNHTLPLGRRLRGGMPERHFPLTLRFFFLIIVYLLSRSRRSPVTMRQTANNTKAAVIELAMITCSVNSQTNPIATLGMPNTRKITPWNVSHLNIRCSIHRRLVHRPCGCPLACIDYKRASQL